MCLGGPLVSRRVSRWCPSSPQPPYHPNGGRVAKYAACGWAVVQMDLDGRLTPPCGVGGVMPVVSEVQRTIKRAEIWALYMALCMLGGPRIFPENEGEDDCIIAGRTDADHKAKRTPKRRQGALGQRKGR